MEPKQNGSRNPDNKHVNNEPETVAKRKKVTKEDPYAPLTDHMEHLRSVMIKSAIVITVWFQIIFSTVGWWFPVVSKRVVIVVLGPFEAIRIYLRASGTISIGFSFPLICWILLQFMRPGLVDK